VKLFERHWEELSPEERAERFEADNLKRQKAAHLEAVREELVGAQTHLRRAEAEKLALQDVDASPLTGARRVEHATAVACADEAVVTLTAYVAGIEQHIRKVS
jgi:hypothetical protein